MTPSSIAAAIKIPAEAILPLFVGIVILAIVVFGGSALARWKARKPGAALVAGIVLALGFTVFVVYRLVVLVPQGDQNDRVHEGVQLVTLLDGPIVAFAGALAVATWRFANQRIIGLLVGVGTAIALIAKPFVAPLTHYYDGKPNGYDMMDLEHLGFTGSGIVLLLVTVVIAALRRPARPAPRAG